MEEEKHVVVVGVVVAFVVKRKAMGARWKGEGGHHCLQKDLEAQYEEQKKKKKGEVHLIAD